MQATENYGITDHFLNRSSVHPDKVHINRQRCFISFKVTCCEFASSGIHSPDSFPDAALPRKHEHQGKSDCCNVQEEEDSVYNRGNDPPLDVL